MKRFIFIIISVLGFTATGYAQDDVNELNMLIDSAINIRYKDAQEEFKSASNKDFLKELYLLDEHNFPIYYLPSSRLFKQISVYDKGSRKTISKGIHSWVVVTKLNKDQFAVIISSCHITYKKNITTLHTDTAFLRLYLSMIVQQRFGNWLILKLKNQNKNPYAHSHPEVIGIAHPLKFHHKIFLRSSGFKKYQAKPK
ncbi:MAG: hypothetical protein EOP47_13885 [Sphingobacteriaceae bacterium]|nr:MAG: hypothetical protein EOP47_13885 [Sphingobacteriaceae bacterium]